MSFGQLAGASGLQELRQECRRLAPDSQGCVGKEELVRLVCSTTFTGTGSLPLCVAEVLAALDLEGCGRIACADWLSWLMAAAEVSVAEGVDAAYNLAGSIMTVATRTRQHGSTAHRPWCARGAFGRRSTSWELSPAC